VRYYDGDPAKHGKSWLPNLPTIRAPETLRKDSIDHLLISPVHHFDAIARHLVHDIGIGRHTTLHRGFDA
jgi:hypothetical protein